MFLRLILFYFFLIAASLLRPYPAFSSQGFTQLFGYQESSQNDMNYLPQWLNVMERHILQDVPEGDCTDSFFNTCHLKRWFAFLESIKKQPEREQIEAVNMYANKKTYVIDTVNYGMEDYWAVVKEFFYNGGDCEDYAITKFFSLHWLGFDMDNIRIVILQDTNLRVAHAVLAINQEHDIFILDNQTKEVTSHKDIAHYLPLFSLNENEWWLHLPPM